MNGIPLSGERNKGWFSKGNHPWNRGKVCSTIPGNKNPTGKWRRGIDWPNMKEKRQAHTSKILELCRQFEREGVPFLMLDYYSRPVKIPDIVYIKNGKLVAVEVETVASNKGSPELYRNKYSEFYTPKGIELELVPVRR